MPKCPYCNQESRSEVLCDICGRLLPLDRGYLSPGTLLHGRYKIEQHFKDGGMSSIYYAWDMHAERKPCVVKQIKQLITSPADLDKLRVEARSMAQLQHTRVAEILDNFLEDNCFYIVIQRVQGKTLEQIFNERGGPLKEAEVVEWAIDTCKVLEFIHQKGVVHRDITPSNLMLNNMGDIVFIDFGTLRELKRVVASRGTAGIGKFGYTPPEQWQGKPVPQSDIFALGATIYYLLTGYLPLSKKYLAYGDPQPEDFKPLFPPIRERNAAISEELERTLSQALQLDVSKRYQSAAEMRQAVQTREPSLRKPSAIRTTPAMLTCCNHKCGKSNKAELIYCEYCEFPLHDGSKQCVKCRLSIPVKLLFCTNCGTRQP